MSHLPLISYDIERLSNIMSSIEVTTSRLSQVPECCRKHIPYQVEQSCKASEIAHMTGKRAFLPWLEPYRLNSTRETLIDPPISPTSLSDSFRLNGLCIMNLQSCNHLQTHLSEIKQIWMIDLQAKFREVKLYEHLRVLRSLFFMEEIDLLGPFCEFIFMKVISFSYDDSYAFYSYYFFLLFKLVKEENWSEIHVLNVKLQESIILNRFIQVNELFVVMQPSIENFDKDEDHSIHPSLKKITLVRLNYKVNIPFIC